MSSEQKTTRQTAPAPRRGGGMGGFRGGMPGQKSANFKESGKRVLHMIAPERWYLAGVMVLGVITVVLSVVGPKILARATNIIVDGMVGKQLGVILQQNNLPTNLSTAQIEQALRASGNSSMADMLSSTNAVAGQGIQFHDLAMVLGGVLLIYVGAAIFGYFQGLLTTHAVQRAVYRLREDVEIKLSKLPLKYFDSQPKGEVLSRVTNDIDNISQSLQQTMSQLITSVLTVIGVFIMMLSIDPVLSLIPLVTIPLAAIVTTVIAKKAQPQFVEQWSSTGELNAHIEEMYTGHALVKVFGHQKQAKETFTERNSDLYGSSFKAQLISGTIQPSMMFISNLGYVFVAVAGGIKVAHGNMSLGDVQAFIQYSRQFTQPIAQVASMMNLLQSGVASAERVFELLDAEEQSPEPVDGPVMDKVHGEIAFDHVAFSYEPETPLITDLSLEARPGRTVAIVGPTGAGKTTLVNLIMRFYEIDGGAITMDGVNTAQMSRETLRSKIGMVLQDTWLFNGSIRENIAYGASDPSEEEIMRAAKATYVDRFVRTLPEGYETVIDEEGSNISAGEKQLLTIARAFLADPTILILDEATSSVDTRTELLVQKAMNKLRQGRTSFVIAHRLSTIRDADLILVMEHGDIVEQGDHDGLLAAGGAYARLYQSQFAGATADVE